MLWGLGLMIPSTALIVHSKGKIACSRKPVLGRMMSSQAKCDNYIEASTKVKPA